MRRLAVLGGMSLAVVAAAACAASEDVPSPSEPEQEPSIIDASAPETALASDASAEERGPLCSSDGWCETSLPESDLVFRDIWPLSDRAFAVAESYSSGIKVLEWTSDDSTWRYIDDNSQNEALGELATKIWAPSRDEVYFAVAPGIVYHGTRPAPPATSWWWTSERLVDNNPAGVDHGDESRMRLTTGVWGTPNGDVYAWYSNAVFRRAAADGGVPTWVPEYIADDFDIDVPGESMFITGIVEARPGDLWFAGVRRRDADAHCDIIVRKTPEGYRRIADGVYPAALGFGPCTAREGVPLVLDGARFAWPMQLQSPDGDRVAWLKGSPDVFQVVPDGDGYSVSVAKPPSTLAASMRFSSMWSESKGRVWLGGSIKDPYPWGVVVQGTGIIGNAGTYELSSIALNGAPSERVPTQIRGTSNTNLWAVGDRYALHKTTP